MTEIAVLISLFTCGLKLRTPWREGRWKLPLRLAFGAMTLTVGMLTLAGAFLLQLPWGAAILLGAILAPTDPGWRPTCKWNTPVTATGCGSA